MYPIEVHRAQARSPGLAGKVLAGLLIVVCLLLGLVGLVLPLIPGIVFLAIAAVLISRHFPAARRLVRKSPTLDRQFDRADRLSSMPRSLRISNRLKLAALLGARGLLVTADFAVEGLRRGLGALLAARQRRSRRSV